MLSRKESVAMRKRFIMNALFIVIILLSSLGIANYRTPPTENSYKPFMSWYQENEEIFDELKTLVEENEFNIYITYNFSNNEFSTQAIPSDNSIERYDDIVVLLDTLHIQEVSYFYEDQILIFHSSDDYQEAIVYRTSFPSVDELGIWAEIKPNCYWVYYTYT